MFKKLCMQRPIYGIYICLILMLLTGAFIIKPAMNKLTDILNDELHVCLSCGNYEVKETATCSECGGTDFALNWCDNCETVFENDEKPTFCPNCGKKQ